MSDDIEQLIDAAVKNATHLHIECSHYRTYTNLECKKVYLYFLDEIAEILTERLAERNIVLEQYKVDDGMISFLTSWQPIKK